MLLAKLLALRTRVTVMVFLPVRSYARVGNSDRNVSVCLSVCHEQVLCQNDES